MGCTLKRPSFIRHRRRSVVFPSNRPSRGATKHGGRDFDENKKAPRRGCFFRPVTGCFLLPAGVLDHLVDVFDLGRQLLGAGFHGVDLRRREGVEVALFQLVLIVAVGDERVVDIDRHDLAVKAADDFVVLPRREGSCNTRCRRP